jgi:hypothetical protein
MTGLQMARVAVRAQELREQSYDPATNKSKPIEQCCIKACHEAGLRNGQWFLFYLAFQWGNDIQDWARYMEEHPDSDYGMEEGSNDPARTSID